MKHKNGLALLLSSTLALFVGNCEAGLAEGVVSRITITKARENGVLTNRPIAIISVAGVHQNPPPCAAQLQQFAIDLSNDQGRAMLSTAQLAFATGPTVIARGKDVEGGTADCSLYPGRETAVEFDIRN